MQLTGFTLPRLTKARRKTPRFLVPVMPGYKPDSRDTLSPWRRKRRYLLLGIAAFLYGFFYALLPPAFLTLLLMPIGILVLLIIWALPITDTPPPRALHWLFWAFFISMFVWPNYLALNLPGLPWITVARLFGGPMLAILLICSSASRPFREEMKDILSAAPWIWKMVAGFAVIQLVSIAGSSEWFLALSRVIAQQMAWTGVFFAAVWVFRNPESIRLWSKWMVFLAVFVCVIGAIEGQKQAVLWANIVPGFLLVDDPAVVRVLSGTFREGVYRVVSTTMSPLSLAEFLALCTPFVIHTFLYAKSNWIRALMVAIDILIIYVIILTDARLGLVGSLTAHALFGLVWALQRWRHTKASIIGPAITLAYPAMLVVLAIVVMSVQRLRVMIIGGGRNQASNDAREVQFEMAPDAFIQSPVFGFGSGQGAVKLGYTNSGGQLTIDSYILSILLDYGLIGFILFYGLIIAGGVKAAKLAIRGQDMISTLGIPIAMFMTVFFQVKLVLSQEANVPLMFMMLGAVVGLAHHARKLEQSPSRALQVPKAL